MNDGFTKLFSSIITSSIWREDDKTRIMWITMLAMCDEDGFVSGSIPGMAGVAAMSIPEAKKAIDRLSSPDEYSRSKEQDGRRIMPFVGGWMIVNYKTYRSQARIEHRKEYMKNLMKRKRALSCTANEVLTGANPSASASASASEEEEKRNSVFDDLIPQGMRTKSLLDAWHKWVADRRIRRKALTVHAATMQIKKIKDFGVDKSILAINEAIERGWTTFYEPKESKQPEPKKQFGIKISELR